MGGEGIGGVFCIWGQDWDSPLHIQYVDIAGGFVSDEKIVNFSELLMGEEKLVANSIPE